MPWFDWLWKPQRGSRTVKRTNRIPAGPVVSFFFLRLSQFRRWGAGKRKADISWLGLAGASMIGLGLVPIVYAAPGQMRWQCRFGGDAVNSSPAIGSDGTIYINSDDEHLYALDSATGMVKWKTGPPMALQRNPSSAAVGPDGVVYVGCGDGTIRAYLGATGTNRWVFTTQDSIYSSPAIGDSGMVYVGCLNRKIYALDAATGRTSWEFQTRGEVWSSPSIGPDGTVYVGSRDGKIYALDGQTGLELWEFMTDGSVSASPAITPEGMVVIGSEDQKVYGLDGLKGVALWEFETSGPIWCSAAIGPDGTIYVGSDDGDMYALDVNSGTKRWQHTLGDVIWSSPAVAADGTVYVGCDNGWLYALNGATGKELWKFKTGGRVWSSPAIRAGRHGVCGHQRGKGVRGGRFCSVGFVVLAQVSRSSLRHRHHDVAFADHPADNSLAARGCAAQAGHQRVSRRTRLGLASRLCLVSQRHCDPRCHGRAPLVRPGKAGG